MNKTISVNLGGRNFFIEESAYHKLDSYLSAIRQRFAQYQGSSEIVADMESRIGEKFAEKYQDNSQAVISEEDVNNLIEELGSVEDIAGEDKSGPEKTGGNTGKSNSSFSGKRLMRNGDDKIIAGVCSGLAAYFNIDPFIIRGIFGVLIFAWGSIIPIYFLLWLIMPEAKTVTEKMQMRGEPLNIDSLGQTIKDRANEFKTHVQNVKEKKEWKQWGEDVKSKAQTAGQEIGETANRTGRGLGNFLRQIFSGIGKIISTVIRILLRFIGFVLILSFGIAIAAVTLSFVTAIFNSNSPYLGFPLAGIPHTVIFYMLLALAYLIALLPLMILFLLIIKMVSKNHSGLRPAAGFSLFGIWVIALAFAAGLGTRYVPQYVDAVKSSPQLQTVSRVYDVKNFSSVNLENSIHYKLIEGKTFSVKATGWSMDLDRLNVTVENGQLHISENFHGPCILCIMGNPTIEITAPTFSSIRATNSSSVESDSLTASTTALSLTNSSRADLHILAQKLTINLTNSSSANLVGTSTMVTAKLANSSHLAATNLIVTTADITAANSSVANVYVTSTLNYTSYNSSRIYYSGNPQLNTTKNAGPFESAPIPQSN